MGDEIRKNVKLKKDSKPIELPEESEKSIGSLETLYKEKKNHARAELTQLGNLVTDCMTKLVSTDFERPYQKLLAECVGTNFEMLDKEFYKLLLGIREIFKELVLKELEPFKEGHEDVLNYMMDMIEFLAERDFKMLKGFQVFKQRANFYVTDTILLEVRISLSFGFWIWDFLENI